LDSIRLDARAGPLPLAPFVYPDFTRESVRRRCTNRAWMWRRSTQNVWAFRAGLARDHRAGLTRTYWPTTTSLICITGLRSV